jgi:hypothetical protein
MHHRRFRLAAVLAVTGLALAVLAGNSVAAPSAAPPQQMSCTWTRLSAQLPQALFHPGAAWDSVNNRAYFNAGLNQSNDATRALQALDFSNAMIGSASSVGGLSGNQEFWGSAGGFRPAGDGSMALFAGGASGAGSSPEGDGERVVQGYTPKTSSWATVANLTQNITLAAAAFHPGANILVVVGGVKLCDFFNVDGTNPVVCDDSVNTVAFVKFDPATGAATVSPGPTSGGPGQIFGGTLVYDSVGNRMLHYGGTTESTANPKNTVHALNTSNPDPGMWTWGTLGTTGTASARALHSAAYDPDTNMMIVYGGVSRGLFTTSENTVNTTFGLDLTTTPPTWRDLGANQPGERVGAAMVYDTNHKKAVLALGRRKFATPNQSVQRDAYYLNCTALPTSTPVPPTATRDPNITPSAVPTGGAGPGPTWTPPECNPMACPGLDTKVPAAVIANALANPATINGYCKLANPGVPVSPWNLPKMSLTLQNNGLPYNMLTNSVVYKAGCN